MTRIQSEKIVGFAALTEQVGSANTGRGPSLDPDAQSDQLTERVMTKPRQSTAALGLAGSARALSAFCWRLRYADQGRSRRLSPRR